MRRRLDFRIVEMGACFNCGRQADSHSIEGICAPMTPLKTRGRDVPEPCYSGHSTYAFVDLDAPHTMPTPAERVA